MAIEIKVLRGGDEAVLARVATHVFDHPIDRELTSEFLNDPRHHLAVAIDHGFVVGFASGINYVHPDKRPEFWVNEVSVAQTHRGRGVGKALLSALFDVGRGVGCERAWVLADKENTPAIRLYSSLGGRASDQVMFSFDLGAQELERGG